ncbi:MAG: T9SS type A sorting domain-containing protein [Bacteroidetes bacterium]|nr:T9SS type A sorting domain-containing protein [Bacteroidota bacterium]
MKPGLLIPILLKSKRNIVLLSTLLLFQSYIKAQSVNISGVVNNYYSVVEVIPAKACVRVSNTSGLTVDDMVMLVQMKGVSINTANNSSFGDTTSLNNAGNYEIGTICSMIGDSVFLFFDLLNQYTVTDKVQLVKIPSYYSATVTDTLKAATWNSTTGTGGVLAINVDQDLTLNAPIFADSTGYRGGTYKLSNGTCFDAIPASAYYYNAATLNPQNGAYKGEGAATVTTAQSGGRAAPANGGGGGNNHNNSGGGGANLSAGGDGGGNASSAGCTTTLQGKGGKALNNYGGFKIFMGGGGGAGHSNESFLVSYGGGNGGGIIFIIAKNIIGNGYSISANGQAGGSAASDGASGAGAGGTIILNAENYVGGISITANGGQGGTENDGGNIGRCYGGGGGGSGGVIYFSGTMPAATVSVTGGTAGAEIGPDASCHPLVPAHAGADGLTVINYNYSRSFNEASYCALLLPVKLIYFKAGLLHNTVSLNWRITHPDEASLFTIEKSSNGNTWATIAVKPSNGGSTDYSATDNDPAPGINFYRLKITATSGSVFYSAIRQINTLISCAAISVYPNPASGKIFIKGITSPVADIQLFDLDGKLCWHDISYSNAGFREFRLPTLQNGIYILKVQGTAVKLIIQK